MTTTSTIHWRPPQPMPDAYETVLISVDTGDFLDVVEGYWDGNYWVDGCSDTTVRDPVTAYASKPEGVDMRGARPMVQTCG